MNIKVEDLKVGDEILVPSSSKLKYMKVVNPPRQSTRTMWNDPTKFRYKAVKLSCRQVEVKYTVNRGPGNVYDYYRTVYEFTPDNHNKTQYLDLNNKDIWLIKRT